MSRCLICNDHPELAEDEMLAHVAQHGLIDQLDLAPARERAAAKRNAALRFWGVVAAVGAIAAAAYVGILVGVFVFFLNLIV